MSRAWTRGAAAVGAGTGLETMHALETGLGHWVVGHRWWVLAIFMPLIAAMASGVRFLRLNKDTRAFFSRENPQLQSLEELENTYTRIDNVLFVINPLDGDVFTRETLTAIESLTAACWRMPYSSRVDSISNFQYTRAEKDDLLVDDLVRDAMRMTDAALKQVRRLALSEPTLVHRLISPEGHVAGVNVNILLPGESVEEVSEVTDYARRLQKTFQDRHPDIRLYLTGAVIFDNTFGEATRDDCVTLVPVMFLMLLLVTWIAMGSWMGTMATLAVLVLSMLTGMGLAGWMGISLTPASANAPTIILTLAVADSIHILAGMFQQMHRGRAKHEAIAESIRMNLHAVFLTSLTTVIGFVSMNFSDAPPFRDLGNIVAMGVTAAFVYSVLFLPALMGVLPIRPVGGMGIAGRMGCGRLADFVITHQRHLLWGILTAALLMSAGIVRIELNDNYVKYFDTRYDIRRATDFMERHLSGIDVIEYSLDSGEPDGVHDPRYLHTIERFAQWYRKQEKVVHVNVLTDTMKRLNRTMHGNDEGFYRIPATRELAAQYLLLYEMSLPFGLDLNNQITIDKSASRMIVTLRGTTTNEQRALDRKARAWLREHAPASMFTYGSGLTMIWAHISERNIKGMLRASFGALLLISGIMIFAMRSLRVGLLSLVPNLMPALMAFGVWGMLKGQVGLGLSIVVSLTLGIVVDDTVHFLSQYIHARRQRRMDVESSVRYAFDTVGTAMWITTVALVAGFAVLCFSGFKMNADMGLMTAITITLALAMDFLLLPALLLRLKDWAS